MNVSARPVWLQLYWLEARETQIAEESRSLMSIKEGMLGAKCPDLASALIETLNWERIHPERCLISAEIRDSCGGELLS